MSVSTRQPGMMTADEVRRLYELEKQLAERLRRASRQERGPLYRSLYNELYERIPYHPQLMCKHTPEVSRAAVARQMNFLRRFLHPDTTFLEIGPGDCALSLEVAKHVRQVCAVDVSDEITKGLDMPPNFRVVLSADCTVPVPAESVTVAYSNQLMEHLHPDDALEQLQNIYRALGPGGVYVCVTPSPLSGPHDASRDFDPVSRGLHLKEYTYGELRRIFREVGFSRADVYMGGAGVYLRPGGFAMACCEAFFSALPHAVRKALTLRTPLKRPLRALLGVRIVGRK